MIGLSYGRSDVAAVGLAASLPRAESRGVQRPPVSRRRRRSHGDGTRQIEQLGGLRRMPWTGLWFLIGAMAISGLPPLNGFASEWLTFQALLFGFRGSADPLVHVLFPVGGALLALTTALAAACFVKAFGMTFVALPQPFGRGREGIVDGDTRSAGVAGRVLRRPWAVSRIRAAGA